MKLDTPPDPCATARIAAVHLAELAYECVAARGRSGKLEILSLHQGATSLAYADISSVLTLDVWEHAYYLDYQNARAALLTTSLGISSLGSCEPRP